MRAGPAPAAGARLAPPPGGGFSTALMGGPLSASCWVAPTPPRPRQRCRNPPRSHLHVRGLIFQLGEVVGVVLQLPAQMCVLLLQRLHLPHQLVVRCDGARHLQLVQGLWRQGMGMGMGWVRAAHPPRRPFPGAPRQPGPGSGLAAPAPAVSPGTRHRTAAGSWHWGPHKGHREATSPRRVLHGSVG